MTLREHVELEASVVRLADVAELRPTDGEGARLAALPLMPAPAPRTQRFLRRREIADLLSAHGINLQDVRFQGAEQVAIAAQDNGWTTSRVETGAAAGAAQNRHAALLAGQIGGAAEPLLAAPRARQLGEELNALVAAYLESKVGQAASWRVACDISERHLSQIDSATSKHVCQGGAPPWTGRQRFVLCCTTPEGEMQLPLYAEVAVSSTPVVVALRPIGRGDVITAADLELRSIEGVPGGSGRRTPVASIDQLVGLEASQSIRAGDVVFREQAQAPIVVKRGEMITVSAQAGGIRVQTTARAREDGARGDLVQVESLETRERYEARVVGPRAAAVFAPARVKIASRPAAE